MFGVVGESPTSASASAIAFGRTPTADWQKVWTRQQLEAETETIVLVSGDRSEPDGLVGAKLFD
jgi:hypothetical protein